MFLKSAKYILNPELFYLGPKERILRKFVGKHSVIENYTDVAVHKLKELLSEGLEM